MSKYKRAGGAAAMAAFLFILSGCGGNNSPDAATPSPAQELPSAPETPSSAEPIPSPAFPGTTVPEGIWEPNGLEHSQLVYSKAYKRGDLTVLEAHGVFPQTGNSVIDAYYLGIREDFERMCDGAAERAGTWAAETDDFRAYSYDARYTAECDAGGYFSAARVISQYEGGAHGTSAVSCDTFSVPDGKLLMLDDFFTVPREEYTAALLTHVHAAVDADPERYYPDAKELAGQVFPYDTFCVTEAGISLFFAEYAIAPFAGGMTRVDISWKELAGIAAAAG